jgi:protein involved in polysaccharide export with SLBB domain
MITGELYLLDLISRAGGLLPSADTTAFLYRRRSLRPSVQTAIIPGEAGAPPALPFGNLQPPGESKTEEVIRVNLKELREGTKPELNLSLQGGDILYVPRMMPQNIFLIGDVRNPGVYTLPRSGQITAAQAIIYAGGPLPTASHGRAFLMRYDEAGIRDAKPVDFSAILEGREPDIPVQPNDIIFVPNSNIKTIGAQFLGMVPNLIIQLLIF